MRPGVRRSKEELEALRGRASAMVAHAHDLSEARQAHESHEAHEDYEDRKQEFQESHAHTRDAMRNAKDKLDALRAGRSQTTQRRIIKTQPVGNWRRRR